MIIISLTLYWFHKFPHSTRLVSIMLCRLRLAEWLIGIVLSGVCLCVIVTLYYQSYHIRHYVFLEHSSHRNKIVLHHIWKFSALRERIRLSSNWSLDLQIIKQLIVGRSSTSNLTFWFLHFTINLKASTGKMCSSNTLVHLFCWLMINIPL